jgi:hypothetical protein
LDSGAVQQEFQIIDDPKFTAITWKTCEYDRILTSTISVGPPDEVLASPNHDTPVIYYGGCMTVWA